MTAIETGAPPQLLGSGRMFDGIAHRYDALNRVMSLGADQRWRRAVVRALGVKPGSRILDVATGTGDLAILLARAGAAVVGVDPSPNMLSVARRKISRRKLDAAATLVEGVAEALPCPDASFDGACIAFGIRNVPDRPAGLREMRRAVKPGGRLAVLELSNPRTGLVGALARVHVHVVVPWMGALVSGDREYRYLARSIAAFPSPSEFRAVIESCGWRDVHARSLMFGCVTLFTATNPGGDP